MPYVDGIPSSDQTGWAIPVTVTCSSEPTADPILETLEVTNCELCKTIKLEGWIGDPKISHCKDCHEVWPRESERQHCTICHQTFKSINSAEVHWTAIGHVHPLKIPSLVFDQERDYWKVPMPEDRKFPL